jgi:hypothetical protein
MTVNSASISGTNLTLNLSESDNPQTNTDTIDLTITNPVYNDTAGNTVESISNKSITDKALPIKISTKTLDSNSNNKADKIILEFSEDIS